MYTGAINVRGRSASAKFITALSSRLSALALLMALAIPSSLVMAGQGVVSAATNSACAGALKGRGALARPSNQLPEPWFRQIGFSKTERLLQSAKIVNVKDLKGALAASGKKPSGTTVGMALVTFEDGTRAVWKPGQVGLAEVAAYKLARAVKSRLVPPTIARTLEGASFSAAVDGETVSAMTGQTGSLQYFVSTPFDLKAIWGVERDKIWERVSKSQKAQRDIFNFVFGNWDLHWGNILIDASYSIVQIDNGVIRSRMKVRYGQLPFIRRISFSADVKQALGTTPAGKFPYDSATFLDQPSIMQVIAAVHDKADRRELGNYVDGRLKDGKSGVTQDVREAFVALIRKGAEMSELETFAKAHSELLQSANLTMKLAFWDKAIWIQAIGFQNYQPILPPLFSESILEGYRSLTFESLRAILPEALFGDQAVREMLSRRDKILSAAERAGSGN